jgi:hypothetical protein
LIPLGTLQLEAGLSGRAGDWSGKGFVRRLDVDDPLALEV